MNLLPSIPNTTFTAYALEALWALAESWEEPLLLGENVHNIPGIEVCSYSTLPRYGQIRKGQLSFLVHFPESFLYYKERFRKLCRKTCPLWIQETLLSFAGIYFI